MIYRRLFAHYLFWTLPSFCYGLFMGDVVNHSFHNYSSNHHSDTDAVLFHLMTESHLAEHLETEAYKAARPFPHAVIDHLFPARFIERVSREIPDDPPAVDGCIQHDWIMCWNGGKYELHKNGVEQERNFGPHTRNLFAFLKSSIFVRFLEKLTGIEGLIPDPHFMGSGIHQTLSGGFLDVHADFNKYWDYNMYRRVNVFLFFNENWSKEYGGNLELWDTDMSNCAQNIMPLFNRFVVFSSTDYSYHGHPLPLASPAGRSRRSIAMYYYTTGVPEEECLNRDCRGFHSTLFQSRKENCQAPAL